MGRRLKLTRLLRNYYRYTRTISLVEKWESSNLQKDWSSAMVQLGAAVLRHAKKVQKYLPNPLAAAGLVRGPAAVRDIVPLTILNNKWADNFEF